MNSLHQLIQSLSKTEKGHFKKHGTLHAGTDGSNYLRLFDAIDSQEVYDEPALLEKFTGEAFTKQFPAARHYLYRMLLKSLRTYHSKHSISIQLNEMLINIEVLFKRRAFDLCEREIKRAKKIISETEMWDKFHEVTRWEKYMIGQRAPSKQKEKAIAAIYEADLQNANKLANLAEFSRLSHRIYTIGLREGHLRNKSELSKMETVMRHKLLKDESKALSVKAQVFFHSIHAKHNETIGYDEGFHFHNQRFVGLMEAHEGHLKNEIFNYVSGVYNLLLSLGKLDRRVTFFETLEKLRGIPMKYPKHCSAGIRQTIHLISHNAELDYLVMTRRFDQADDVLQRLEKILSEDAGRQYELIYLELHYYMAYTYFARGEYRKALKSIHPILNSPQNLNLRADLSSYSRILALAIHYELGNERLLESYFRSTYRHFLRHKSLPKWEKAVVQFLKVQLQANPLKLEEHLRQLRIRMRKLAKDPLERQAFDHFDFVAWIDSQLGDVSFLEAVQRNF